MQYATWLGQLARGDLGQSIFLDKPVLADLADRDEPTFWLTLMSLAIASAIALPVGIFPAGRPGTGLGQSRLSFSTFTSITPSFRRGVLSMKICSDTLGWSADGKKV